MQKNLMDKRVELLAKKIEKMSPAEYEAFMESLTQKIKQLEAKYKQDINKLVKLLNSPKSRELADHKLAVIAIITLSASMALMGVGGFVLGGMADMSYLYAGASLGFLQGAYNTMLNAYCYSTKPLSQWLNKVKIKILKTKMQRCEKIKNQTQSTLERMQALEK